MAFAEKMVLAVFSVSFLVLIILYGSGSLGCFFQIINMTVFVQMLIVLWMTRSITDDIPGWGALFKGRAGDGTVSVSSCFRSPNTLLSFLTDSNKKLQFFLTRKWSCR